jgi:hypothetical protein
MFSRLVGKINSLLTLRQDVDEMQRDFKLIRHEWEDWFERYKRLHARIARRQQREEQDLLREEEPQQRGEHSDEAPMGPGPVSYLSPKQRLIQQQLLARRARLTAPKED